MCYCITTRPPSENGNFERETLFYISYCENWDLGFLKKLSCGPCASEAVACAGVENICSSPRARGRFQLNPPPPQLLMVSVQDHSNSPILRNMFNFPMTGVAVHWRRHAELG